MINIEEIADCSDMISGKLNDREIAKIQAFIKMHYKEMYLKWKSMSDTDFYGN